LTSGVSVTLTEDTLVGLTGRDAAKNPIMCDPSKKQFSCEGSPPSGDPHYVELYTPDKLQTSYYHENEDQTTDTNLNFGHAVAVGDLDGDGTSDIIAIGAPAYSYTDSGAVDVNKGAVYLWYNDFRERALLTLIDNDVTTDVSSRYLEFATDGFDSLRIFLDPSDDTSSYGSALYQAASGAYSDKTQTTATEIATVLNKAFLSSFGKSYQNYLYADASTDYGSVTLFDSTDDAYKIYDTTGDGRLGHAVVLYDNTSDGYLDIYTAAPYYNATHTNGGKIYKINQQVFAYSDATNDITTVAAGGYVWNTADNDDVDAAESLFGYSLVAGYAKNPPFSSSFKYLFVGIPGSESSINGKGKVASFFIHSGASLLENQTPPVYKVFDATGRSHFGSSLAIVDSGFDTSGTGYCPCLVVGAPGETTDLGKVWVFGDFSYSKSLSGSSAYDRIGVNLLAGKIEPSFSTETLFITAKREDDKGHLVIVKSQPLTTAGTDITAQGLNEDLSGTIAFWQETFST
jgi:hypothetical protein